MNRIIHQGGTFLLVALTTLLGACSGESDTITETLPHAPVAESLRIAPQLKGGIWASTSATTRADINYMETVRIVAMKAGAPLNPSAATCVADKTYTAYYGMLSPTDENDTEMTLKIGTYDFYIIAPADALADDGTVSADNGAMYPYAATVLRSQMVDDDADDDTQVAGDGIWNLSAELDYKCTLLFFSMRYPEGYTIQSLTLHNMAKGPLKASFADNGTGDLEKATSYTDYTLSEVMTSSGSIVENLYLLPRPLADAPIGFTILASKGGQAYRFDYTYPSTGAQAFLEMKVGTEYQSTSWIMKEGDGQPQ